MAEQNSHQPEISVHPPPPGLRQLLDRLLKVPGVIQIVVSDKHGVPLDDQSDMGQSLATRGKVFIDGAILAGKTMGVGETKSVAVHDHNGRMLVYASDDQYLHIAVTKDVRLALVEAAIGKILATGR